ncbi:hypothetical protein J1614_010611 [Plenodomus biglobosus]|nr:hypothetical protein J1614_010611 [Plenodomus biglobosus]
MRLVGPIGPPVDKAYNEEFMLAKKMATMIRPSRRMVLITTAHWRQELEDIPDPPVPTDLLDFIQSLLIVDSDARPTASEALLHSYMQHAVDSIVVCIYYKIQAGCPIDP